MKFAIVNTKTLGYRQTHLSPKKMNKMNALELFSLLPTCVKYKITSNLSMKKCLCCWVTKSCNYANEQYCSECDMMLDIRLYGSKVLPWGGWANPMPNNWIQQKEFVDKHIGFMFHHRYRIQEDNEVFNHYTDEPLKPTEIGKEIISHSYYISYIKIVKVLKKTIHYKLYSFDTDKNTTKEDVVKWLKNIHEISKQLPIRKACCCYGINTNDHVNCGIMVSDDLPFNFIYKDKIMCI